jgi:two-component system sensor histidine kinase VanS
VTVHLAAEPLKTAFFEHLPDLGQLALLCAALGLMFFCVVRRLIVRPIRETADAAQAMTAEKLYGFPYDSTRGDEIGQLNSALHDMSYRLRRQWEAERELERQRQEFLAAASHDLKTPLALIGGSAEAIAQEIDPDENARYLATIERECARMNGMIAQMLDASRVSQMNYLEKPAPFELPVLLEGLLLDREVLFGTRLIEKHIPSALSYCGDRAALGRAIGAMLDNAAQYSAPDAKITVTLTDLQPGFRLTIENEGTPIPDRDLPHLFELFYRADHARDRKGSGIGLAVAARIFDLHGLKYRAENVPNGVRFTVETPL